MLSSAVKKRKHLNVENYNFLVEEHRLVVFENRVLRRIFGPKSDGVTED
jgi:hypothetical protein